MIVSTIILAAGQGTRMRSNLPKVLHRLAGRPLIDYSLRIAAQIGSDLPVVVAGYGADAVRAEVGTRARFAIQVRQLGTAHAVMTAESLLSGQSDLVVVLSADMPLLSIETLRRMIEIQSANSGPMTILTILSKESHGFGRVLRGENGSVKAIIEEAHATPEQLALEELNAGIYCFSADWLWQALHWVKVSPKGEYYLTDTVEVAVKQGFRVDAYRLADPTEAIGINTRAHLAEAETLLRNRINTSWMLSGVTIVDPNTTYIGPEVKIGQDTIIYPGTHLQGETEVGQGCLLGPNAILKNTKVGNACRIGSSALENSIVEDEVRVSSFCSLGPGAHLAVRVMIGHSVEINHSYLAPGVKVGHSAYLGDATVGENSTIGAGTVTCNLDQSVQHPTEIGAGASIGSNSVLVAPVKVGDGGRTGAGAVVTDDIPPYTLVKGVPARRVASKQELSG
jgi:bifunctional UDP-N-acetylglucosamine pyrophosphorylase/glucosamine-1-phosphate N-acetyltransferase